MVLYVAEFFFFFPYFTMHWLSDVMSMLCRQLLPNGSWSQPLHDHQERVPLELWALHTKMTPVTSVPTGCDGLRDYFQPGGSLKVSFDRE